MSTCLLSQPQSAILMDFDSSEGQLALNNYIYHRTHECFSFEQMKRRFGRELAIALERQYQGIAELNEQKLQALNECNRILTCLGRPQITAWPNGVRGDDKLLLPDTPLDVALGIPISATEYLDIWYFTPEHRSQVIDVVNALDTAAYDEVSHRFYTSGEAEDLLEADEDRAVTLNVVLPETLCGFLRDWRGGLYPELEAE